jgi:DNA repair protein RecO (recombination protein O)
MSMLSTPAVLIRRTDYGDYDLILKFLTLESGALTAIAKSAKKSTKRFAGILELFSMLNIVVSRRKGRGMPVLQEAALENPLSSIRGSIEKTAYASYWSELIQGWMEEWERQPRMFHLLRHVLLGLHSDSGAAAALSILFQMQMLQLAGFRPNLRHCSRCGVELNLAGAERFALDLSGGGIRCVACSTSEGRRAAGLSASTIKQLLWAGSENLAKATRMKFSPTAIREGIDFLEGFVPYHLGRQPRSLKILRQIRGAQSF